MNIKTIIERINVVTRSRFSANGGASWIQWASDIISRIERECPGTGNLKDVQALPMASGFIPKPMSLIDITHVLVDGLPVKFEKTDAGIRLVGDEIPALTSEKCDCTVSVTAIDAATVTASLTTNSASSIITKLVVDVIEFIGPMKAGTLSGTSAAENEMTGWIIDIGGQNFNITANAATLNGITQFSVNEDSALSFGPQVGVNVHGFVNEEASRRVDIAYLLSMDGRGLMSVRSGQPLPTGTDAIAGWKLKINGVEYTITSSEESGTEGYTEFYVAGAPEISEPLINQPLSWDQQFETDVFEFDPLEKAGKLTVKQTGGVILNDTIMNGWSMSMRGEFFTIASSIRLNSNTYSFTVLESSSIPKVYSLYNQSLYAIADGAIDGWQVESGSDSITVFKSTRNTQSINAFSSFSILLNDPSRLFTERIGKLFKSNVILRGYKAVHKPESLTEEFDMDDRYYQLLSSGLHMMAERDMEPAGNDAAAREQAFLGELRRYRVNLTQARGKAAPKRYSFTPRFGGNW